MAKYINQQQNYKHAPHLRNQLRKKISFNQLSQEYLAVRIYPKLWQSWFGSNSISDFRYAKPVRYSKLARSLIPAHRHRKKIIAASLAVSLILSLIAPFLPRFNQYFGSHQVQAAWYDDSWSYREKITIGNTGSADSSKKVKFDIDTATIITAGKSQSDCDDFRFTDANGKLLRYYLDSAGGACNTNSTDFYVLVETINSGNTDLYMYYGNPSAIAGTQTSQFSESTFAPTSGPTVGSEEKATSPQVYLKFDEGYDTNTQDSTANNNDGSISGATWKTSETCLSGNCLYYDGTDDVVTVTNADSIDFDRHLAAAFTISAWIRPNGAGEGTGGQIFYKGTNTWLRVDTLSSGKLDIQASLDLTTPATLNVSAVVNDNAWNHVALSYTDDGDDEITIWVNGRSVGSSTDGVGSPSADSNNILIGGNTSNNFKGFIDEFKIYKQERSAAQIIANAQKAPLPEGAAASFGPDTSALSQGLVGYWKMDDSGVDAEGETSTDSSGNGNTGTLYGDNGVGDNGSGMDCTASGKFGTGCDLDGTDDYISVGANPTPTNAITLSAWIYAETTGGFRTALGAYCNYSPWRCHGLRFDTNFEFFVVTNSSTKYTADTTSITTNRWYHVVGTYDGSSVNLYVDGSLVDSTPASGTITYTGHTTYIGAGDSNPNGPWDGKIDEARIYSRALSPAEVSQLYSWAPGPVRYWNFEEGSGTTLYDRSGNGDNATVNGTITNDDWASGRFGKGLHLVETTNDYIDAFDDPGVSTKNFTLEAHIKLDRLYAYNGIFGTSSGNSVNVGGDGSGGVTVSGGGLFSSGSIYTGTGVLTTSKWYHIALVGDGTNAILYVDGVNKGSKALDGSGGWTNRQIGTVSLYYTLDGIIDEVRFYNYGRTPAQIIEDMNAGHPAPGSPIGSAVSHWKFDEGYLTTAYDNSVNANNLTLSTASWTNSGKFGKAFNGLTNVRASRDDDADLDFAAAEDISFSVWFKSDSTTNPSANEYLLEKGGNITTDAIGYAIYTSAASDGLICFGIDDDATSFPEDSVCSTSDLYDNTWHHILAEKTGTSRLDLYVDGKPNGTPDTAISATGTLENSAVFYLGDTNATDGTDEFLGDLDEVKIFRSALTADQVKLLYNQSSSAVWGATSTDSSGNASWSSERGFCPPGDTTASCAPVGEWKLDENTGTSTTYDTSTGGRNGTLTNIDATDWVPGKYGSSLNLDGSNEYIDIGTGPSTVRSVEFWVYPETTTEYFINLTSTTDYIEASGGTLNFVGDASETIYVNGLPTTTLASDQWQHVVVVTSANENASNLDIGRTQDTNYLEGKIDQVRIYDYALSQAQVAWNYNRGAPLAYWQFDECSGSTAYDSAPKADRSSTRYDGTIYPVTLDNTAVGTCGSGTATEMWNNGTNGKRNASLDFDGSDDYVQISDNADLDTNLKNLSISFWAKLNTLVNYDFFLAKQVSTSADGSYGFLLSNDTPQKLNFRLWSDLNTNVISSDGGFPTGTWTHVVGTWNGTLMKLYINGVQQRVGVDKYNIGNNVMNSAYNLTIGAASDSSNYIDSQIDDVKIFNYALTAQQIKIVYNDGVINFAPITGSP